VSADVKRTWGWIAAIAGLATICTLALGWISQAQASGAREATLDLRVRMLEQGQAQTREEIKDLRSEMKEIRQDGQVTRRILERMCALTAGCKE
jgi:uncharacterized protein YlxW (UPF0749 family)